MFVVFRRPARQVPATPKKSVVSRTLPVEGPWNVTFEGLGAPPAMKFEELRSWTEVSGKELKHFAGTARYRTTFEVPADWIANDGTIEVDLGRLWTIGEVWLNGKPLGISWTPPFKLDAAGALKQGSNELVVEVTNTWYNRLVGDASLPPDQRLTKTNVTTSGGLPWAKLEPLESGLFGPVRIVQKQ